MDSNSCCRGGGEGMIKKHSLLKVILGLVILFVSYPVLSVQGEAANNSRVTIQLIQTDAAPVTIKYQDSKGNDLAPSDTLNGKVGLPYSSKPKDIESWKLKEAPSNASGIFTNEEQTVVYVYTSAILRFYDVPSELSFNETKISSHTQTILRKKTNWKITVEDTRLNKKNWRVTAQLSEQFKDSSGQSLKYDILLFRKGNQNDQWITSNNAVNIFDGTSKENEDLYDVSWKESEGPIIQAAPGTVKVGKYTGVINWKLIDAPA